MSGSLEHDVSSAREFYRDLRRDFQEPVDREGIAFQKWYDWQIRQRMLPTEILAASNASSEEVSFLLGGTDTDPDTKHKIIYYELIDSGAELELWEIDVHRSVLPKIRVPRQKDERPFRERLMTPPPLDSDALLTFNKQVELEVQLEMAMSRAQRASDMNMSEWEAIEGITDELGKPTPDPHPDHLPVYRRLIPAPQETPILEVNR